MLTGKGKILLAQEDTLLVSPWNSFTFSRSTETKKARGWPYLGGSQVDFDSEIGSVTYTLKLTIQSIGLLTLSHLLDTKLATSASTQFPVSAQVTVPSGTPEVTVAGLTPDQEVQVSAASTIAPAFMKQVTSAPAATLEYQVVAGKIVFHSSDIGKLVTYRYLKTFTNVKTMGVENADPYGYFEYSGILEGPLMPKNTCLYLGQIKATGNAELAIADDVPEVEVEYNVTTPSGWPSPWRIGTGILV